MVPDRATVGNSSWHRNMLALLVLECPAWGAMMAASAVVALTFGQERELDARTTVIAGIYFAGGFLAYGMARPLLALAGRRVSRPVRFVLALVALAILTLCATAGALAFHYRAYYAQWHEDAFSVGWFYQQVFTFLGSTYQYLVLGTRFYWPLAPLFLLPAAWWLSRRAS